MFFHRWMEQENVVCVYIYIQWSIIQHKKKEILSFLTRLNLECIMLSELNQTEKRNSIRCHLYEESYHRNKVVVARVWGRGKWGDVCQRYKFLVIKRISSEDLMYSMVIIVNNTILCTWQLLRVNLKHSYHTQKELTMLTMWGDGCVNYLDLCNPSTIYAYQIIMSCTLNIYNYTCQLFLNKVKKYWRHNVILYD